METKMKLYDKVRQILKDQPQARNSDKYLQWEVMRESGIVKNGSLDYEGFYNAPSMESIRRVRQKIQEKYVNLRADETVQGFRRKIQKQKGTHVYREVTYDDVTGTARYE